MPDQSLYRYDNFYLIYDGGVESNLVVNRGLKEGSCLSPILFLLFVSDLPKFLESVPGDFPLAGGGELRCLQFADDVALMARNRNDLQKLVDSFVLYCRMNSLIINPSKRNF